MRGLRGLSAAARPDLSASEGCGNGRVRRLACRSIILYAALLVSIAFPKSCPGNEASQASGAVHPFSPGEALRYKVVWNPPWYFLFLPQMEAGELRLSLVETTEYEQKPAARVVFEAISSGTLANIIGVKIHDTFESLSDPVTLCTYTARKQVREGKRKRDTEVTYYPEERRLHIVDTDVGVVPPKTGKDKFVENIPSCVHDIFAAVYALRRADLQVGSRNQWVLGTDENIKTVETRVVGTEMIQGHAGLVRSLRIETVALLGGLFKEGGQFRIWLTDDARRLPVRFEIQVKLGKVYGRLVSVKP